MTASAHDDAEVTVIHPCISLEKVGPAMAHEGDTITYSFVLENCSTDAWLYGVTVSDPMLGGVIWGPADLAPGEEVTFSVDYIIPQASADPVRNEARAVGKDVLNSEWMAGDLHYVDILHPCIDIAKDAVYQAHEGDTIVYSFTLRNCSVDTPLHDVTVTDPLLGGIIWGPETLAAGAAVNFTVDYTIPGGAPDPLENIVTAAGKDALDKEARDEAVHYVDILHPCIDLVKDGPPKAYEGETITYNFTLTNCSADADLHDVTVTDPLLGGVIWGPGYLEAGTAVSFAVNYVIPVGAPNPLINLAVAGGYDPLDRIVSAPASSVTTFVLRPLGFKFWDQDWDASRQPSEPLMGRWEIRLIQAGTGVEYAAVTNASSTSEFYGYWFAPKDLPAGIYYVYECGKPGWVQTYPTINKGVYHINYHEDGTFELLSPSPRPYYGLSFGNMQKEVPGGGGCPCFDWVVFQSDRDGNWDLYRVSAFGGEVIRLTDDPGIDTAPTFNRALIPSDTLIAFQSNRLGKWDIFTVDLNGENLKRLTGGSLFTPGHNNTDPVWAPLCGVRKLAFVSDRDGNEEIYLMNADGKGQQRLTNSPAADTDPDWSPAGDAVVFQSLRNGNWDIYRVDITGRNLLQLTNDGADEVDPAWSPDGRWIAFRSNRAGTWDIYIIPADGGDAIRVSAAGNNAQAVWSPSSERLAYHSDRDGNWEIYVGDITTGEETRVTFDDAKSQWPTWSCVGDSVVYATDADGNWELYHVQTWDGMLLARVTDDPATDVYPAWIPAEEDGSREGSDIPMPTPVPTATPEPTATPTATARPTSTPVPTQTPIPLHTPAPRPDPGERYWIRLPLIVVR